MSSDYSYTMVDVSSSEPVEVDLGEPMELEDIEVSEIPIVDDYYTGWEEIREVTRCTGQCCLSFTLAMSPVQIGQRVIASRRGSGAGRGRPRCCSRRRGLE